MFSWIALGIPLCVVPPRSDPDGRLLAHPVLVSDDWRQRKVLIASPPATTDFSFSVGSHQLHDVEERVLR